MKKSQSLAYLPENALNAICPYFTMFPLEYPLKALRKHRKENSIVLDPFCGRGTTLFAARALGLSAWGLDSSPVAVAIARAKLATCEQYEPIELARELMVNTIPTKIPDNEFFQAAYHPNTLRDICAIKEGLERIEQECDASVVLRAALLGCLHGPLAKNVENTGYFSNQMPRTYASKPDYAVRYWAERGLVAPKLDVLQVLKRKIYRLQGLNRRAVNSIFQVAEADSRRLDSFKIIPKNFSVVVTSPPYYGMRTYVQDQWLRNWVLGGPDHVDYASGLQLDHGGIDTFSKSLGSVWGNIAASSNADELHMYIRFGVIPSSAVNAKEALMASLQESGVAWRIISVRTAKTAEVGNRQADQMKTKSSAAAEFDFHVVRA